MIVKKYIYNIIYYHDIKILIENKTKNSNPASNSKKKIVNKIIIYLFIYIFSQCALVKYL